MHATPAADSLPTLWLLGSSDYSARLAARFGLPYVFAYHFSGDGIEAALELYRTNYVPSAEHPEPQTFLTLNASVAPTAEEARRRALPQMRAMARMRTGRPLTVLETVEDSESASRDSATEELVSAMEKRWVIGAPDAAATAIRQLASRYGVDEVMVSPIGAAFATEPLDETPGRAQTLELLAGQLL